VNGAGLGKILLIRAGTVCEGHEKKEAGKGRIRENGAT